MEFENKIVLVTGASRGIGYEIAKMFSNKGAIVVGTSTNKLGISKIEKIFKKNVFAMKLDVSNFQNIKKFFEKFYNKFNNIDILVNNAGIIKDNLLIRMKIDDWNQVLQINLHSIFYISKIVVYRMLKKKFGRIINISSLIADSGNIGQSNYSTSKSGLIGFSKSLAREVASRNITVNVVSPGFIKTDMTKKMDCLRKREILKSIPMNRFGEAKEVANVVLFLASEKSSYITGETIHINGGIYMR
ncbi:3-oxoacyl-[acyl-carrier-protein] reductase [bacterium endosymbiont of Pedicinus badii]|uniref:3-oxoacyl-[acyl-carrier-protein] reductase n=1 Tax=bacterium endosymbiont of Pedicinus badii TaxID=1719126 RepID=UPI0009BC6A61|nr:3-oxoacyl-[acyl-carrier-protein] reductase [bacterium endosymbiont of Pedicinus badii]OQM34363.1 3-ketoacyl-ACP reductase [bacterium endosymbiont of Pedicinus badii]